MTQHLRLNHFSLSPYTVHRWDREVKLNALSRFRVEPTNRSGTFVNNYSNAAVFRRRRRVVDHFISSSLSSVHYLLKSSPLRLLLLRRHRHRPSQRERERMYSNEIRAWASKICWQSWQFDWFVFVVQVVCTRGGSSLRIRLLEVVPINCLFKRKIQASQKTKHCGLTIEI